MAFTSQLGVCRRQQSAHSRHLRSNPDHSADDIDRLSLNTVPAWIKDGRVIERDGVATSVLTHEGGEWKIAQHHSSSRAPRTR
nr:nuclear transport factor 2 family protein [Qipengyuania pacifica]